MSDLTSLHSQAKRLILLLREGLERLEALERISSEMDSIWRMQVIRENSSKRDVWKRKVEQVSEELDSIRQALDRHTSRESRRAAEQRERDELLARGEVGRKIKQEMDEEAQMAGSVQRSKRYLEEMFDAGTNILANMAGNRERLKSAQKKALDVLNSVGLGESMLRMIERRQRLDMYTAYGGMAKVLKGVKREGATEPLKHLLGPAWFPTWRVRSVAADWAAWFRPCRRSPALRDLEYSGADRDL
ncbi:Qb-SNARE, Bos1/Membrin family [Volvox carteri f. nagariensis]|uniref:Qb-SNARE, Bos1/Membrin family n=1 Tax=Volvox carteri f. nagariensis TaxID=3068 RepID=D8TRS5_VOLCA|nr:Qb-SNARE, Bos1/Membrin family [Volvox carteri f. nagariensis]EFJ49694.1 Qb-SNARE, Bos1/Membrin family [Volvox carteri f. nagariensis]|eukprot:XP_002949201.1 Qb-SNARE, Bos1/Membrin family [Volvox carteri f. nagariensis]